MSPLCSLCTVVSGLFCVHYVGCTRLRRVIDRGRTLVDTIRFPLVVHYNLQNLGSSLA